MLQHKHCLVISESDYKFHDLNYIEDWVSRLVYSLGMNMLLGPFSVYCSLEGNEGITAGALLSTSHIMLHIFEEETSVIQLDVYSCSDIDLSVIKEFIEEFSPNFIEWKFLDRETGFIEIPTHGLVEIEK